jgi:hypothetical protein
MLAEVMHLPALEPVGVRRVAWTERGGSPARKGARMAAARTVGIILIAIGIVALVWGGISWTREETIVDLGPLEAKAEQRETIPLPPVLGGIALVAGIVLLVVPARRRT